MISKTVQLAVISVFGLVAFETQAAPCALSAAPTGSAYINAYNQGRTVPPLAGPAVSDLASRGNFGSSPQAGSAGDCEVTPASDIAAPWTGYTLVVANSQSILNPSGATIGTAAERVWRKPAATAPVTATNMCIIGTKVSFANNVLYDGVKHFEANDIVRGGYGALGTLNVAYRTDSATNESRVYRIGRTFTSVQHRPYKWGGTLAETQNNGTGYLDLPSIGTTAPSTNINGVNAGIGGTTVAVATAAQQEAAVAAGWVDFTTDAGYLDDDAVSNRVSAMTYIEFACGTNTDNATTINSTWRQAGALRIRRTAQEDTTFADIVMTGYAPPGSTVAVPTP
jgi:hypothetical protein